MWRQVDFNQTDQPALINSAGSSNLIAADANLPDFHNNGSFWNDSQQQPLAFHQMPPQCDRMPFQQAETKHAGLNFTFFSYIYFYNAKLNNLFEHIFWFLFKEEINGEDQKLTKLCLGISKTMVILLVIYVYYYSI